MIGVSNMPVQEIEDLKSCFVEQLEPIKIYLFGSCANGTDTADSDLDFYIVVDDSTEDLADLAAQAFRAIRRVKKHPVDILIGTSSHFEARKTVPSVENEVYQKGVFLLYGS